jgi:hypothetical protein
MIMVGCDMRSMVGWSLLCVGKDLPSFPPRKIQFPAKRKIQFPANLPRGRESDTLLSRHGKRIDWALQITWHLMANYQVPINQ